MSVSSSNKLFIDIEGIIRFIELFKKAEKKEVTEADLLYRIKNLAASLNLCQYPIADDGC
jgi:hypothetical protein